MSESSRRSRTRSRNYEDPTLDLRYMNTMCYCYKKAEIIVVSDIKKANKGRLFYNCERCNFFKWCEPIKASWKGKELDVGKKFEDIDVSSDEDSGEEVISSMKKKKKKKKMMKRTNWEANLFMLVFCCILVVVLLIVLIVK